MRGHVATLFEHAGAEGQPYNETYHYRECGLDNIWLSGGVSFEDVDGQRYFRIEDAEPLHEAIALEIVHRGDRMTGHELRFLRHELSLTQADLARLLETDVQAVARWEKGKTKAPGPADRLIRFLYLGKVKKDRNVMEFLEELADLDRETNGKQVFKRTVAGWKAA